MQTVLFDRHVELGARIVDFAGWRMPIYYGSQLQEHHAVRRDCGMFDVSHMTVVDLKGEGISLFLRYLLANDITRMAMNGQAMYTVMLNERGGVVDDLIVYRLAADRYRLVVNAATKPKDMVWLRRHAQPFGLEIVERDDLAIIAVQGPESCTRLELALGATLVEQARGLRYFTALEQREWLVARTGYTGEDGFEVMLPNSEAVETWNRLLEAGVAPVGLGARDTLRLEAGMNLYGSDMDEDTTPLESGLAWTVAWDPAGRTFLGRSALEAIRAGGKSRRRVGLVMEEKGIPRGQCPVWWQGRPVGVVRSGTYSPTLEQGIALAIVEGATGGNPGWEVEIRGNRLAAIEVHIPFVRQGQRVYRVV